MPIKLQMDIAEIAWLRERLIGKSLEELKQVNFEDPNLSLVLPYLLIDSIKDHLADVMEIFAKWLEANHYLLDASWSYLLAQIGKLRFEEAMCIIMDWLTKENNNTIVAMTSDIVKELAENRRKADLLPFLTEWVKENNERHIIAALDAIGLILFRSILDIESKIPTDAELRAIESKESDFIDGSLQLLKNLAKSKGIDSAALIGGEHSKIFQCACIIDGIKYYSKPLDYDVVFRNVKKYTNIEKFLTYSWFINKRTEQNRRNVILRLMSFDDDSFLSRLNTVLGKIMLQKLPKQKMMAQNIKNEVSRQDYATLSELGFISHFLDDCKVELYPQVGNKRLEARIWISGVPVLFEVKNLDMFRYLKAVEGVFMTLPDTIKRKINSEYEDQLKDLDIDTPLVLAIDLRESEASLQNIVDPSSKYFNDKMKNLSGIILFKNPLYQAQNSKTLGLIIANPFAVNALSSSVVLELQRLIFK